MVGVEIKRLSGMNNNNTTSLTRVFPRLTRELTKRFTCQAQTEVISTSDIKKASNNNNSD